jgi:hypothetical protein
MMTSSPPSLAGSAKQRIKRVNYDAGATLADARRTYFEANGFAPDGGYEAKWVNFELGPIPVPFPNTDGRRRAVKIHDLHHVLTNYQTDIYGESEISAWELGAGCGSMIAAWLLNLGGLALGMLISPRRTWRAWIRGRQARTLYDRPLDDQLLGLRLGDVRTELGLDRPRAPARVSDALLFVLYWQIGAWSTLALLPLTILTALLAASASAVRRLIR